MPMKSTLFASAALVLAACSPANVAQYEIQMPAVAPARPARIMIEVAEVSLPLYAQSQEIAVADAAGAIRTDPDKLWADDMQRAVSLALAESLMRHSGAVVAAEPWPLLDRAEARLDVRVKTLVAGVDGQLRFAGQYFLVFDDARRPRINWFDLSVPLPRISAAAVSRATGLAIDGLAQEIAGKIRR